MQPTVVLVHGAFADSSSWGAVISNVDAGNVTGLVYVNGFAPAAGENCFGLAARFPGSMVGEQTVRPVPLSDGTTDFYIAPDSFHEVFCPDVGAEQAARADARRVVELPGAVVELVLDAARLPAPA